MIPSKARAAPTVKRSGAGTDAGGQDKPKIPDLDTFLNNRDYQGSIALLQFKRHANRHDVRNLEWLAYCHFHYGEHDKALNIYKELLSFEDPDPLYYVYAAACYYFMGMYKEAETTAAQGPRCPLQTRVLFHCAHKGGDEAKLMNYHQQLTESIEDQLSLASIHYQRSHFQEATDIYKRLLLENREFLALNVYVALCYCKLDYYDVSLEILQVYLDKFRDSAVAVNLKACNTFRMYNGKAAEAEIKTLAEASGGSHLENDLIRHNLVVFRGGENALQYLPPLGDVPPEARLNLVIHHLRHNEVGEAFNLVKDLEPTTPQEYILKGVVHACIGQSKGSTDHLKTAQQYFQLVGASQSECDTIPGRQCMASCFFLLKQFEDVLVFLQSIKSYFPNDDDFNWNYGIAKAACGKYREAEETLALIQNEKYRTEYCYLAHLARCYIMNGRARLAWELYLKMETSEESYQLLQLIANDAYKMGAFFYAAKAFDVLERLDPAPEYLEGKKGACIGTFQAVIAGREPRDCLRDVVAMLRANASNPQIEMIVKAMRKWAKDNGVAV
uniref:Intraflagellar transport protein 56 n=1 Tax=Chlamydomonas leiostraca TaxID=1034604 RepID=A0A7S0WYC0_9CHLO|mmetsp:Transcript_34611/g.87566  ORF Transcript_34611/g.87566 Transcript_34611/m.87566 type:complete len:557 (+) Transcript_34611:189-1859(+)|eukprot:CAMPEP_0202868566 /NCGR_PEP_ID=MMETSP1391-20130828/10948_1 /ASSEMBLY_ACC=CAM_ASM_000867 /TAXON_ID=1034604 /ORGANISM="Chlamydomonas leiostraca, Strain SAG 11-49" /LENGTH=556 /DNA_ID=CAMNT_0049548751 /DNA_START=180 /DNA_END=1850 /DNA_ORIENTATION=+